MLCICAADGHVTEGDLSQWMFLSGITYVLVHPHLKM